MAAVKNKALFTLTQGPRSLIPVFVLILNYSATDNDVLCIVCVCISESVICWPGVTIYYNIHQINAGCGLQTARYTSAVMNYGL